MELEIGSIYEGKVTGITKFGAFVLLPTGKSGMVHISEVANTFVSDINDYLKEGQAVTVKLISIDQQGRINLSIKKAADMPKPQPKPQQRPQSSAPRPYQPKERVPADASFEDKLKQFMADSDSKISGLYADKRSSRRRGGGRG